MALASQVENFQYICTLLLEHTQNYSMIRMIPKNCIPSILLILLLKNCLMASSISDVANIGTKRVAVVSIKKNRANYNLISVMKLV
jgi:hypothetical protein